MYQLKLLLVTLALNMAVPYFAAATTDSVDSWRVGQKVVFRDHQDVPNKRYKTLEWFRGTIVDVGDKIPFFRDAYIKIRTDLGEIRELKAPFHSIWSADYACDSRGLCVGQTALISTYRGAGDVLKVKVVSVTDDRKFSSKVVGEISDIHGEHKAGKITLGYSINLMPEVGCDSSETSCPGDGVMFVKGDEIKKGRILNLVGDASCQSEDREAHGGYVIEDNDGSLLLSTECYYDDHKKVVKIHAQGVCNAESGLCRGQPVYYPYLYTRIGLGYVVASNGSFAYIQAELPSPSTELVRVKSLGVTEGCLEEYNICVGDQVLIDNHSSPIDVVARYKSSSGVIVRDPGGSAVEVDGKNAYIMSGCIQKGFCVGDRVQLVVLGHKAKIVGIKDELLAVKFETGERAGQIAFGLKRSELSQ